MIQKTYHIRTCLPGIMLPKKTKQNSSPLMFPVPPILAHQHTDYYVWIVLYIVDYINWSIYTILMLNTQYIVI